MAAYQLKGDTGIYLDFGGVEGGKDKGTGILLRGLGSVVVRLFGGGITKLM